MADFIITGPDGKKYKVSGDNAEGALAALKAHLGEASAAPSLSAEDQAYREQALKIAADRAQNGAAVESAMPMDGLVQDPNTGTYKNRQALGEGYQPTQAEAAVGGGMQGVSFGGGDEFMGAIGALTGQGYDYYRELARARLEKQRQAYPKTALASEIAGALTVPLPAPWAKAGIGWRTAGSAATGAGAGGLYGFLSGEGGGDARLASGAFGAALGGTVGAAAPGVVAGAKKATDAIIGMPIRSFVTGAPSEANAGAALQTAMDRAGTNPSALQALLAQAANEGQPMFGIADGLGASGQNLLSGITRQPGPAKSIVTDALVARQSGQGDRLGAFVADGLGASDTAASRAAKLRLDRATDAKTNYTAADDLATPVNLNGTIDVIDALLKRDPIIGQNPLRTAPLGQRLEGIRGQMRNNGSQLIDFETVRNIKSDMFNAMQENPRLAAELRPVYSALDQALEASSTGYRKANDEYRAASKVLEAIDTGREAAQKGARIEDTKGIYMGLSPDEQAAFRSGYSNNPLAKLENARIGTNKAPELMTPKRVSDFNIMAKDPGLLNRRVAREDTMFQTANRALGGPKTAEDLQNIADAKAFDVSALLNILTGHWVTAGKQVGGAIAKVAQGRDRATNEMIAKILLGNDVKGPMQAAAKALEKRKTNSAVAEALIRRLGVASQAN